MKHGASSASSTNGPKPVLLGSSFVPGKKPKLTMIQTEAAVLHQSLENERGQEAMIDDAYNKKMLRDIYRDLSSLIKSGPYFGDKSIGLFGGDYGDIVALRNRVIRRLATLEKCVVLEKQLQRDVGMDYLDRQMTSRC